jgi:hypothetical protein
MIRSPSLKVGKNYLPEKQSNGIHIFLPEQETAYVEIAEYRVDRQRLTDKTRSRNKPLRNRLTEAQVSSSQLIMRHAQKKSARLSVHKTTCAQQEENNKRKRLPISPTGR